MIGVAGARPLSPRIQFPRPPPIVAFCLAAMLSSTATAQDTAGVQPTIDGAPNQGQTAEPVPVGAPRFLIQGFGDIEWMVESAPKGENTFKLGQLVFFGNSRLDDQWSVLAEVVLEASPDGEFVTDLERLHLTYSPSDYFRLRAGRYHTGIGYYNTAFHHSAYYETTADRPALFAFEDEGGVLPVHDVGVSVSGRVPSGSWGVEYLAEVGNGQNWNSALGRTAPTQPDSNRTKSTGFGVSVAPDRWGGLRVGVSSHRDRADDARGVAVAMRFDAVYLTYRRTNIELLAESVWLQHRLDAGQDESPFANHGMYFEGSRRIGRLRPFVRYERLRIDRRTPLIGDVATTVGPTIGVRFDPIALLAVKAQYERESSRRPDANHRFRVQAAFSF